MTIKITIETDNAAFSDGNRENEIARILHKLAKDIKTYGVGTGQRLRDINGNTIGTLEVLD